MKVYQNISEAVSEVNNKQKCTSSPYKSEYGLCKAKYSQLFCANLNTTKICKLVDLPKRTMISEPNVVFFVFFRKLFMQVYGSVGNCLSL